MRFFSLSVVLILLFSPADSWTYNGGTTHPKLTERAISESEIEDYFEGVLQINEGLKKVIDGREISQWIEQGAEIE